MAEEKTADAAQGSTVSQDTPLVTQGGYVENQDHRPDPYFQYGTIDTTGLGGPQHTQLQAVSPVFDMARAENLRTAARALDPDDPGVPAELVVLPESTVTLQGSPRTAEEAREQVLGAVQRLAEEPIVLGVSPEAQAAAQGVAPEEAKEEPSPEPPSAGSATTSSGTSSTTTRKPTTSTTTKTTK